MAVKAFQRRTGPCGTQHHVRKYHSMQVSKTIQTCINLPSSKGNPPNDIDNDFRQISVLPQLAKVLEKLQLSLHRQVLEIRNNQHAFIQNRSTVSALACISQK